MLGRAGWMSQSIAPGAGVVTGWGSSWVGRIGGRGRRGNVDVLATPFAVAPVIIVSTAASALPVIDPPPPAPLACPPCPQHFVTTPSPSPRPGPSRKPPRSPAAWKPPARATLCSRPATAPPACRISAPSARSPAPPGCATPSPSSPACRPACSRSATTWTGCARCPTTCRTRTCWPSISASR